MTEHQKGIFAVVVAAVLWSTGGLFIKQIDLAPLAITAWRSVFAAVALGLFFREKIFRTNRKMWLAALFHASTMLLFVAAIKLTTAANAIFLQFTAPIYVLLAEPFLFKMKLKKADVLAVAACLAGMAFFFVEGENGTEKGLPNAFLGNILALCSGVTLAAFMLLQRQNPDPKTNYATIFWSQILVVALALVLGAGPSMMWPDGAAFSRLAFLGIIQIGLATALFTYGLQRTLAIEASLLAFVEPILNPIWVWLGFGERPSSWAILGGSLIVIALFLRAYFLEKGKRRLEDI